MKCPVRRWQLVRAVPPVSALSVVVNKALNRLPPAIVRSICAELLCRIDCVPQPHHVSTVVNRSAHVIAV
nr:MAG TPA: hypothetical protein [Caudoviricetes sp.]